MELVQKHTYDLAHYLAHQMLALNHNVAGSNGSVGESAGRSGVSSRKERPLCTIYGQYQQGNLSSSTQGKKNIRLFLMKIVA
jgi:hypothetical protein